MAAGSDSASLISSVWQFADDWNPDDVDVTADETDLSKPLLDQRMKKLQEDHLKLDAKLAEHNGQQNFPEGLLVGPSAKSYVPRMEASQVVSTVDSNLLQIIFEGIKSAQPPQLSEAENVALSPKKVDSTLNHLLEMEILNSMEVGGIKTRLNWMSQAQPGPNVELSDLIKILRHYTIPKKEKIHRNVFFKKILFKHHQFPFPLS